MDVKMLARLGAVVFVAFAIVATVIDVTHKEATPIEASVTPAVAPSSDPLDGYITCLQLDATGRQLAVGRPDLATALADQANDVQVGLCCFGDFPQ